MESDLRGGAGLDTTELALELEASPRRCEECWWEVSVVSLQPVALVSVDGWSVDGWSVGVLVAQKSTAGFEDDFRSRDIVIFSNLSKSLCHIGRHIDK